MKGVVFRRYGSADVLELAEVEKPAPKDDEVLVRVHAVSINDWDWQALQGVPFGNRIFFGLLKPKKQILGSDIAGIVEAIGGNVRRFKPGDAVYGDISGKWGGFADYVCARESLLALKPASMTFEQAAAIPQAAMLAVQALRDVGKLRGGQKLLINGAGGGVGTFAVQLAKLQDVEVTAVDSAEKLDMLRGLGADHVIDYRREDATRTGRQYDLILDVKTTRSLSDWGRVLKPNGTYVTVGGDMSRLVQGLLTIPLLKLRKKNVRLVMLKPNKDLPYINDLFEAGKLKPILDRPYTLSQTPEAMRRFGEGKHLGKVVIRIDTVAAS